MEWLVSVPGWGGRALEWRVSKAKEVLVQETELGVIGVNGQLSIGFAHSGYTGDDPDGKQALLTVSLVGSQRAWSSGELAALAKQGWTVRSDPKPQFPAQWLFDVTLARDVAEEARIRTMLGLPKTISVSSTIPAQIKWDKVDGHHLFEILTNVENGLRFVARPTVKASYMVRADGRGDSACLQQWWSARAGSASELAWRGGPDVVAQSLIESECFSFVDGLTAGSSALFSLQPAIAHAVAAIAKPMSGGRSRMTRGDFLAIKWSLTQARAVPIEALVTLHVSPGLLLQRHPEYVKDLTNGVPGLEALKTRRN